MAVYALRTTKAGVNTATTTMWNIWSPSGGQDIEIIGLSIYVAAAPTTAPDFYVVKSTARGTQTTSLTGNAFDPNANSPTVVVDSAWSVNPTVGAATTALWGPGGWTTAIGSGIYDKFDLTTTMKGRANTSGLAIVNANAAGTTLGTFGLYLCWRE